MTSSRSTDATGVLVAAGAARPLRLVAAPALLSALLSGSLATTALGATPEDARNLELRGRLLEALGERSTAPPRPPLAVVTPHVPLRLLKAPRAASPTPSGRTLEAAFAGLVLAADGSPQEGAAPSGAAEPDAGSGAAGGAGEGGARGASLEDLAKMSQNPVANLISVPFQYNANFGFGPTDGVQSVLNIQPVIPFTLSEQWNLITRTIVPVIYQPPAFEGGSYDFGMGDITFTAFLSPSATEGFIWGAGPAFLVPTATSRSLGQGKLGVGPSVVGLYIKGPWVVGALANNIWSVAGSEGRPDVNQMLVQPFVNYNLPGGWFLTSAPIITANWEASSDERWTLPVGGGVGRVFKLGGLPVNMSLQGYWNAERPDPVGEWTLRFQLALLFPR